MCAIQLGLGTVPPERRRQTCSTEPHITRSTTHTCRLTPPVAPTLYCTPWPTSLSRPHVLITAVELGQCRWGTVCSVQNMPVVTGVLSSCTRPTPAWCCVVCCPPASTPNPAWCCVVLCVVQVASLLALFDRTSPEYDQSLALEALRLVSAHTNTARTQGLSSFSPWGGLSWGLMAARTCWVPLV